MFNLSSIGAVFSVRGLYLLSRAVNSKNKIKNVNVKKAWTTSNSTPDEGKVAQNIRGTNDLLEKG